VASGQQKTLWISAVLAALAIALITWLVPPSAGVGTESSAPPSAALPAAPSPQPIAAGAAAPKLAAQPATQAQPEAKPEPAKPLPAQPGGSDLFAGEMPDFMADLHARVLEKKWLGAPQQKQLYDWGKQHPNDARPQLLLAWDSRNREWDGIAAQMYAIAYKADPRAKQEPSMLSDLIAIGSNHDLDRVEGKDVLALLQKAYGPEALPRIDQELAKLNSSGQYARAKRLEQLRAAIR
jgi:hypothetical protein